MLKKALQNRASNIGHFGHRNQACKWIDVDADAQRCTPGRTH
jgi:hypothetical protein